MKIIHICPVAYIDGWGYQDNLLPEYMAKRGHDVVVVASSNHFPAFLKESEKQQIIDKGNDYYCGRVHIYRNITSLTTSNYTFIWKGLNDVLRKERPDVIFHHGINSSSMMICWWYILKNRSCKFIIDNHADYINESKHKLWNIFIRAIMKLCVKMIQSTVTKFYGVTPGRCDYLRDMYGADKNKVKLYPIGFDVDTIQSITETKDSLRKKYGIENDAFVILSGGKMGEDKGTISLINALKSLKNKHANVRLVLFGRFTDNQTEEIANSIKEIKVLGWCSRKETLELIKLSDIACWPIHHTTLIEDAVGTGIPVVIRSTPNTSHLIERNGKYVMNGTEEELYVAISEIIGNYEVFKYHATQVSNKYSYRTLVEIFERDIIQQ